MGAVVWVGKTFSCLFAMCSGRARGSWLLWSLVAVMMLVLVLGRTLESRTRRPVEVGFASWYGPGFHGEETASGEVFDQREMVAAHRTLPLGSVIRVTNLENGRRVTLRVIDRGPYGRNFRRGTIVDVSRGAARRLRMVQDGLVKVRIEVMKKGDRRQ
jgi:rare lipoprotein A (peptidoglycan hydrolase)